MDNVINFASGGYLAGCGVAPTVYGAGGGGAGASMSYGAGGGGFGEFLIDWTSAKIDVSHKIKRCAYCARIPRIQYGNCDGCGAPL